MPDTSGDSDEVRGESHGGGLKVGQRWRFQEGSNAPIEVEVVEIRESADGKHVLGKTTTGEQLSWQFDTFKRSATKVD